MSEQKHFQKDEDYPLRLLKRRCLERGLDFVAHYGLRALLYNGAFFGLTTLKEWNCLVQKENMINDAKLHFLREAQFVARHNIKYVIRSKDLADNPFLINLVEAEMCNGIGIYCSNQFGVVSYFFNAAPDNKEALQLFVNKIHIFELIVNEVDKLLERVGWWQNMMMKKSNHGLLGLEDRRLIFSSKKFLPVSAKPILLGQAQIPLTRRENQIVCLLEAGNTTKDLAGIFNVGVRTIESHLRALRKKTGVHRTKSLISNINQNN